VSWTNLIQDRIPLVPFLAVGNHDSRSVTHSLNYIKYCIRTQEIIIHIFLLVDTLHNKNLHPGISKFLPAKSRNNQCWNRRVNSDVPESGLLGRLPFWVQCFRGSFTATFRILIEPQYACTRWYWWRSEIKTSGTWSWLLPSPLYQA
jgi:hypothetical protein